MDSLYFISLASDAKINDKQLLQMFFALLLTTNLQSVLQLIQKSDCQGLYCLH